MSKVKICGLSRMEDIDIANSALPDFIGFVFAPSKRRVDAFSAAEFKKKLDPRIESVGVFVNETVEKIAEIHRNKIINLVQLHGDEDDNYIKRLRNMCGCRVIKAIGINDTLPLLPNEPDYLLFDTLSAKRGGTGESFDWSILKKFNGLPYFLAGGLDVTNVSEAMNILSPFCVDVSSGVEVDGMKDKKKIDDFVRKVRHFKENMR